jgi:antitoxin VapB
VKIPRTRHQEPAAHRLVRRAKRSLDRKKIDAICAKISALPVLDARTPDEILGYDEYGIPR